MKNYIYESNDGNELFYNNKNISSKPILLLVIIVTCGLLIRYHYTPFDIPILFDGFSGYFLYALDITRLGHLPSYTLSQSGWGEFLSLFFTNFHSENLIDYMNLQRTISIILSGLTVIPVYFICRKFFSEYFSLIGATIFALEPSIILNSVLGISEPLYVLVITLGILFFLNSNRIIIYLSFGFFAWATIIRPEGQFWFVALSVMYFIRFRKNRKDCLLFLAALAVFLLVISPIVYHRIECCDNDQIIGRIIVEISNYSINSDKINEGIVNTYGPNFQNGIKLLGWSLFPIFIIFLPFGLIPILKKMNYPNFVLFLIPTILAIPIIYSLSIAPDTRYVYSLFPIFCIISLFGIRWIRNNLKNEKIVLSLIILGIISSSLVFLELQKVDHAYDKEAFQIAKLIEEKDIQKVNSGSKIMNFLKVSQFAEQWSKTGIHTNWNFWHYNTYEIRGISSNAQTLEEFIIESKESNLSHIIVDDSKKNPKYILELIDNKNKYPFLIKEIDSIDLNLKYDVKIYKIDYNVFEEYIKNLE